MLENSNTEDLKSNFQILGFFKFEFKKI